MVNARPGATSSPQLWVLPANGTGGFGTAVLIDANYGSSENLQDTLVVGATIIPPGGALPVVNPGDLLVLTSNPIAGVDLRGQQRQRAARDRPRRPCSLRYRPGPCPADWLSGPSTTAC